jgi:type I restriction enzyme R subunit
MNEAETCTKYVVPKLRAAGWDEEPHAILEQRTFDAGRVVLTGDRPRRVKGKKKPDYVLRYTPDFLMAVVEAKAEDAHPAEGLSQAMQYAELLGLSFAYSTNGHEIVEHDYLTGKQTSLTSFPRPDQLWRRYCDHEKLGDGAVAPLLFPAERTTAKPPRYYQEIAIHRAVKAILQGRKRALLTLATGTGKTAIAFQICWKLWNARWNRAGDQRRPKILFLADRNILVDDPKDKTFAPFKDACFKIEGGKVSLGRDIYFAIYQALVGDANGPGAVEKFPRDFFDLVIVDECHRGSARDDSTWRAILDYFESAHQLGLTATPLRDDNRDTYEYFNNPLYEYSLGRGIEDGFLAPYRVHRVTTDLDESGWRPDPGTLDRYGREIPVADYQTKDFERVIVLRERTRAIAQHVTDFLRRTDPLAKTIVFCVDQEHALDMLTELKRLNADLVQKDPHYVCRVTADEGDIGLGHLDRFKDVETSSPVIVTTSQLLTTGVDVPTCKNIVLARVIRSMTEFKQIIGRGTRLRTDEGKWFFNILDYTGSSRLFEDDNFDGTPALITEVVIDAEGKERTAPRVTGTETPVEEQPAPVSARTLARETLNKDPDAEPRKFYADQVSANILRTQVHDLDADLKLSDALPLKEHLRKHLVLWVATPTELRSHWGDPARRAELLGRLHEIGVEPGDLAALPGCASADPCDVLAHVAFGEPLRTYEERAAAVREQHAGFFDAFPPEAREVLFVLLQRYAVHGLGELVLPDALKVSPLSDRYTVPDVLALFGGGAALREAVERLQELLYTDPPR